MKKIFVATPFNHPDENIKNFRIYQLKKYCIQLLNEKNTPISALLMGPPVSAKIRLSTGTS